MTISTSASPCLAIYSSDCRLRRLPKTRAVEVLEQVGLADHASFNTEKLSPGLSRRLAREEV